MTVLTVITVVKDDPDGLRRTLTSLQSQRLDRTGIVVLDGSTDRAVVPGILGEFPDLTVDCSWQQPRGVYAAMNDALARAHGQYVHFLNAGDVYADADVVARACDQLAANEPVWAYGDVRFVSASGQPVTAPAWDYVAERDRWFARGRFPAHQGVFVARAELVRQGGFDTSFRIVADYASILKCVLVAAPLQLGFVVAEFREGGLSSERWQLGLGEFHRARREVLRPSGLAAVGEQAYTVRTLLATTAYRALWAEGRPAHAAVARVRSSLPFTRA